MGDNIKALTEVYVALGGNASDIPAGASNADIIALIATVASGGGGAGLPAVTSDNNGDVLTVVDGAWDKAAPSGGSEIFEVVFEAVYDDGIVVTSNHTAAEILAAKNAGKYVTSKALFWGAEPYVQEFGHTLEENSIAFYYNYVCVDNWGTPSSSDYLSTAQISWSDSGWVCFGGPYALTPSE